MVHGANEEYLVAFLDELISLKIRSRGEPISRNGLWVLSDRISSWGRLPDGADLERWQEILGPVRQQYPDVETLALHWLCHVSDRLQRVLTAAQHAKVPWAFEADPLPILFFLVWLHPPVGSEDKLHKVVLEHVRAMAANPQPCQRLCESPVILPLRLLAALEAANGRQPLARMRELLLETVALHAAFRRAHPAPHSTDFGQVAWKAVSSFAVDLIEAGLLSEAEFDALLLEFPRQISPSDLRRFPQHMAWDQACAGALVRFVQRALAGDPDPNVGQMLYRYPHFSGINHFLAACRLLDQHPTAKLPVQPLPTSKEPTAWAVELLRRLPPPNPADRERASELAKMPAETLMNATLLAPAWAELAAPHTVWPAWGQLVGWLARYGGPGPWSNSGQSVSAEEEETGATVDRLALQEAVELMGEARLRELCKHRVARSLYRKGLFYAEAILGWNAATVEEKFLKRAKEAVLALGMLPDEGDILQRYLALRKFAKEARQFGAKRQASEQLAVEGGLTNLAVTAGYLDRAQLEWSMEAQLVAEIDPNRRWLINGYSVWLEADEACTIRVERDAKALKSVPPTVRQAPEYAEIKEAREQLQAQWDRIRRRLELAMVLGEVLDRQGFTPALITPAGRAMVPNLVMRCWLEGADGPMDLLGFRTVEGDAVVADLVEQFQVAHPLDLRQAGALGLWQKRLVSERQRQPFNQLFRECYTPTSNERQSRECYRFAGRRVRAGTLVEKLKRRAWYTDYEGGLQRRLPGRVEAELWFADGARYMGALETLTVDGVRLHGPHLQHIGQAPPRLYSELLRDVDQATMASASDPSTAQESPETLEARAALAQALVPDLTVADGYARTPRFTLHLSTGSALDPAGHPIELRETRLPADFPYADCDPHTAEIMSRLVQLAGLRGGDDL